MGEPALKHATYEDLRAVPVHQVGELVTGELHVAPRPAGPHATVAMAVGGDRRSLVGRGRGGTGEWIFLIEAELHLGADVVIPDIAGWRRTGMAEVADVPYVELAPDWLCEVLSPSTERFDRAAKLGVSARAGVAHVWFVNPRARTVELLWCTADGWLTTAVRSGDEAMRAEPFDAVEIDLTLWWADLAPAR